MFDVGTPNTADQAGWFLTGIRVVVAVILVAILVGAFVIQTGWWAVPLGFLIWATA